MSECKENKTSSRNWQKAMRQITELGGAVFSNKALRKYFRDNCCKSHTNKTYSDMADVYGQIVSSGCYYESINKLQNDGSFYISSKCIAEEISLPVRRVRDIVTMLCEHELIEKKKITGEANRYKVNPEKFEELVKDVKFKCRGNEIQDE
ncbi:hypothetical protein [Clostridium formicaceticum]|uniref:Uncharacterized protein n=1 Tax=Clostridium formicaceticum TaxID=1497 RepID=A0AAC9RGE0_9CLOT|nr:hypothetical protein [Clostridium formicaceticum]AOY76019.1 hypothetical protein BJL90_08975 [Clostridium formicaceticum]ARE86376.1 hypothetical protein CLFO_06980 [Clostridium formicaceticum]